MFEDIFNYRILTYTYYFWFLWYTNFEVIAILNAEFPARKPGLWLSCCFSRYFLCGGEFAWDGSHHQLSWVISSGDASDAQSSAFRRASYHSKGHGILCWKPQVVVGWADLRCWCWWSNKVKVKLACNPCCLWVGMHVHACTDLYSSTEDEYTDIQYIMNMSKGKCVYCLSPNIPLSCPAWWPRHGWYYMLSWNSICLYYIYSY